MSEEEKETFIVVPQDKLSTEAFEGLIEEFILREGTDYGHSNATLDAKKQRVLNQIDGGHVKIVYSSETGDCTLLKSSAVSKLI